MLSMKAETASTSSDTTFRKGAWSNEEDEKLRRAVDKYGLRNWVAVEKYSGLNRPAKNCRLRWLNYLRPNLKKHPFTLEEQQLIFHLHSQYGNSWCRIASKLPGRSDNEIKNFWHKKSNKHHRTATSAPLPIEVYSPEQTSSSFLAPQQFSFRQQPQMQFSSPLKIELPTDSQVASFSAFQLQSPNSAPLSPLKLRLSIPIPSEFCFGSNPSVPDTTSQLIQAESDSKPKIMKELREAQARVRFLKKKLKLRRIRKKTSKTTNLAGSSSDSISKECNSGTKNLIDGISESQNHTEFGKDYSLGEIFKREDSMTIHNQIGFSDHLNIPSTMDDALYREDSALLQGNYIPVSNAFDPVSRQTTSNNPDDDISWATYLQLDQGCYFGYNFEQEMSDNLKMNSLPSEDMLDSSCFVSAPIMEQEYFRVEDFSFHQKPSEGNLDEANMLLHKSLSAPNLIENPVDFRYQTDFKQECPTQNLPETCRELMEGLMVDNNLWAGVELMDSSHWNC